MKKDGHEFFIIARNKDVTLRLLDSERIQYKSRGKGARSPFFKFFYFFKAIYIIWRASKLFKPDLFLSFASPYAALVAKIMKKSSISLSDTDNAKLGIASFVPLTKYILTPKCFKKYFGEKHFFFNGYMELCYLHPKYFKPDITIFNDLGLNDGQRYIILRFVSWSATHDLGIKGLNIEQKRVLIEQLSRHGKIFISSEGSLPAEFKPFQINIPPEKMHDVLACATLYIGEGATMASECAVLGTPCIYFNPLDAGTLCEQSDYGLLHYFKKFEDVLDNALGMLKDPHLQQEHQKNRDIMLSEKIDVTSFIVWFLENFPSSVSTLRENPDYSNKFRMNLNS
jgi:predicted glycosyltransferase